MDVNIDLKRVEFCRISCRVEYECIGQCRNRIKMSTEHESHFSSFIGRHLQFLYLKGNATVNKL